MSQPKNHYAWAVVGAGPAGITAVGLLLDSGVSGDDIVWIDPDFEAGDFGRYWGEVNSNTRVSLFQDYLHDVNHFNYSKRPKEFLIDSLERDGFTLLKHMKEPLLWVTKQLQEKVVVKKTLVRSLSVDAGAWKIQTAAEYFFSEKVILAMGSDAKSLNYPGVREIDLITALTPTQLKKVCNKNDVVAVFGSSHSAMIIIRNLVEAGVERIVNFYQSTIRYAVLMDDWILYDDTGLKGDTARWVHENIARCPLPQISRYLSSKEHIDEHLPNCAQAIFAVGFRSRHIPVTGVSLSAYDTSNGIIAPGLFGMGIGFPMDVTDPFGRREANVGVWKFLKNMRRALPLWQKYTL